MSRAQVFVNAELFQNRKLDSADERLQMLTYVYQWAESDFNYSSLHENLIAN